MKVFDPRPLIPVLLENYGNEKNTILAIYIMSRVHAKFKEGSIITPREMQLACGIYSAFEGTERLDSVLPPFQCESIEAWLMSSHESSPAQDDLVENYKRWKARIDECERRHKRDLKNLCADIDTYIK